MVGPRLKVFVNSEPFAVAVGLVTRADHAIRVRSERATRRVLHFWNLPAGSDVTRLLNEIGKLQQEVRALTRQLDAKEDRSNGLVSAERPARTRSS
jgi:hypothetical protein